MHRAVIDAEVFLDLGVVLARRPAEDEQDAALVAAQGVAIEGHHVAVVADRAADDGHRGRAFAGRADHRRRSAIVRLWRSTARAPPGRGPQAHAARLAVVSGREGLGRAADLL